MRTIEGIESEVRGALPIQVDQDNRDEAIKEMVGIAKRCQENAYYSGMAKAAQIAKAHKGSAEKKRLKSGLNWEYISDENKEIIRSEERGEDIASELIHKAIQDEMKGLINEPT